jgi:hypothetical protein
MGFEGPWEDGRHEAEKDRSTTYIIIPLTAQTNQLTASLSPSNARIPPSLDPMSQGGK